MTDSDKIGIATVFNKPLYERLNSQTKLRALQLMFEAIERSESFESCWGDTGTIKVSLFVENSPIVTGVHHNLETGVTEFV